MRKGLGLIFLVIVFFTVSFLYSTTGTFSAIISQDGDGPPHGDVILEGIPQFVPSDTVEDHIDEFVSMTYGSDLSPPPSGMGQLSGTTSLIEASYISQSWVNLLTQSSFTSTPSGWSADGIVYTSGHFTDDGSLTGNLYCSAVDTTGCDTVRFTLSIDCSWEGSSVYAEFWNGTHWKLVGLFTEGSYQSQSFSSSASEFKHSNFRVRVVYADFDESLSWYADNWEIEKQVSTTYYRFQAIYKFTGIDYAKYATAEFYVNFTDGDTSDTLEFRVGSISPTTLISSPISDDFNVDVHDYLTGPELYVDIRDVARNGDGIQSTWLVERLYLKLSNSEPSSDGTPIITGLVNGNYLLSEYNYVTTSVNVSDSSGFSNISQVILSIFDETNTEQLFSLVYQQAGVDSFTEGNNSQLVILDSASCQSSKLGDAISLLFNFTTDFACPSISNVHYRVHVVDIDGETNPVSYYPGGWIIESRVSFQSIELDDGYGTSNRGDTDQSVLTSGEISYFGLSSFHPLLESIQVSIECNNVSGSPWSSSDYNETDGSFSVSITSDDDVGLDFYSIYVRSDGYDCLDTSYSLPYISDEIICVDLSTPSMIVDSMATGYMETLLRYSYDQSYVVNGSYMLGDRPLVHQTGGMWQASYAPHALLRVTYNQITANSSNVHGISKIDMNGTSLIMYWEELVCYLEGPADVLIQTGFNASGITFHAEYFFWEYHGERYYNGTLHLNDTTFLYETDGRRYYIVSTADGDDEWAVSTIHSSSVIFILWADIPPTTTSTTTTTTTTTTATTTDPPEWSWLVTFGISILGILLVAFIIVICTKRGVSNQSTIPEKKEDLATALDYLDMISEEHDPDHDDKT